MYQIDDTDAFLFRAEGRMLICKKTKSSFLFLNFRAF